MARAKRTESLVLDNALFLLVASRLLGALVNIVHDCDEVYNYWEPLHYLLYGYGASGRRAAWMPETKRETHPDRCCSRALAHPIARHADVGAGAGTFGVLSCARSPADDVETSCVPC